MPVCKNCKSEYPWEVVIDGKKRLLAHRKYCLVCSPFGKHNTKRIDAKNGVTKTGLCSKCGRNFVYDRKKGHQRNTCNSCLTKSRRDAIKKRAIEYKGEKCQKCGYFKCIDVLCFHHRNGEKKEFGISNNYNRNWEVIKKELDKCDLFCLNCHAEIHTKNKQGFLTQ